MTIIDLSSAGATVGGYYDDGGDGDGAIGGSDHRKYYVRQECLHQNSATDISKDAENSRRYVWFFFYFINSMYINKYLFISF